MPLTGFSNYNDLQSVMHQSQVSGDFMATGAGDNSYQSQMTGFFNTGLSVDRQELENHIGREYYRKLDQFGLTPTYTDTQDAGFRPLTFTGMYTV